MKRNSSLRGFKRLLLSFVLAAVVLGVVVAVLITAFFSHEDIAPVLQTPESETVRPVIELPPRDSPVVTKEEARQEKRSARGEEAVFGNESSLEVSAMAAPVEYLSGLEEVVATARPVYAERVGGLSRARESSDSGTGPGHAPFTASADEELWIIAMPGRSEGETAAGEVGEDASPGTGAMHTTYVPKDDEAGESQEVPLPLKHTAVQARITGYVTTVDVTQQFENPFETKIEAVYVFPLPEKAAVSEFVMTIGERRIRGILREREEAEQIYAEARSQGYQASLLVQHRPNIFEQKVANIEPGHRIDVNIRYFHTLAYRDGWYSFVFPTVVGPRYNPPGSSDPVQPLARTANPPSGIAVQYLPPTERSGHDIAISLELDAGVAIEAIEASHLIDEIRTAATTAKIALANRSTIPNRDFVLEFKVAGGRIKSNLLTYAEPEKEEGYFTLMLYPPADIEDLPRHPLELVFVLDCSGSMEGEPIAQAKAAVLAALNRLQSDDTFQIIRFSNYANQFSDVPLPATSSNLERGRQFVQALQAGGGTEMNQAVSAALNFPQDPQRLRFVTFLTDGYIGNEVEILREIHQSIGAARIFSFGVGSSVNRYLMERMASAGRGAAAFLGLQDSGSQVMNAFFDRVSHPALANVSIDWDGMQVSDVYPSRLPDLFVGRPVFVTGKYRGEPGEPRVSGRAGGEQIKFKLANEHAGGDADHSFLPQIWARQRIADLVDKRVWAADRFGERESLIRQTAMAYGLMSDYTAYVAVDTLMPTPGDFGITVVQPVPVPVGVRYETTVPPKPMIKR